MLEIAYMIFEGSVDRNMDIEGDFGEVSDGNEEQFLETRGKTIEREV